MNFVQSLEESLRDLAAEARKQHPGVKEASERATLRLRALQNEYVLRVRQANAGGVHPTTRLFASSELLHPFLLAANYPNASAELLDVSFRAMRLLMEADALYPPDALQLVRVWMIQAQVVVQYYQKQYTPAEEERETSTGAAGGGGVSSSTSSWFSWSKTTTTSSSSSALAASSMPSSSSHNIQTTKSSTTASQQSPSQMETRAKQILSCLLQLLENLKQHSEHLTVELWMNATTLSCVWLHYLPRKHTVHQATKSTLSQVMNLLFACETSNKLQLQTWQDLLILSDSSKRSSASTMATNSSSSMGLTGAFQLCKQITQNNVTAHPPTFTHALELLVQILKDTSLVVGDDNSSMSSEFVLPDSLIQKTMETSLKLLLQLPNQQTSVEHTLRIVQWTTVLFRKYYINFPNECRELFVLLLPPIAKATEACRKHDDFEDGFILNDDGEANTNGGQHNKLTTLLQPLLLWKAGLALEAIYSILDHVRDQKSNLNNEWSLLLEDAKCMVSLSETLSDFATILTSCKDHILQLAYFCQRLPFSGTEVFAKSSAASIKPTLVRNAEQACSSGNAAGLLTDTSSSTSSSSKSSNMVDKASGSVGILGETIWISLQGILRIAECMYTLDNVKPTLEQTFAPSLAVLQHVLKRCIGSSDLVQLALRGYVNLADVCIPNSATHRRALLMSLCKLSLPTWGKRDPSCQLQDHNIITLLYLCRIVHTHFDDIGDDWNLILQTFDELSVMLIASKQLSESSYHAALAVSVLFGRMAPFTTCFSTATLLKMAHALTDITKTRMEGLDVVGNSDTVLAQRTTLTDTPGRQQQSQDSVDASISSKIMSMGVRAIYGSASESNSQTEGRALERTKNVFYEDYRQEFVKRLSFSQTSIRVSSVGHVPYVLALLTDVIMANSFRFQDCGDELSSLLSTLASTCPAVRPFTMDILSVVAMSHMSNDRVVPSPFVGPGSVVFRAPMQSQLWAVEHVVNDIPSSSDTLKDSIVNIEERGGKSQSDLLSPLCQKIQTTDQPDMAESSLGALNAILEGVGHNITGDIWSQIIGAVASLSGDPYYELVDRTHAKWASCSSLAFRCLKFLLDDFREKFSQSPGSDAVTFTALLDCCSAFGRAKHDVNTSLTAITLLWTIADQDRGSESIDRALFRLVNLASDTRAEVRNAAVNTLFSCIVGRGALFSPARWESCFSETIFGVYDMVAVKAGMGDDESLPPGEKRYRVSLHHSRDSNQKQWLETQVIALRGLTRLLRNYFSLLLETTDTSGEENSEKTPWFQDAWVRILDAAFDAATQGGGRDTLGIRTVGLELMVLCCQLASDAGIGAATPQARVGTNMEVINGALRTVRESQPAKVQTEKSLSVETNARRNQLFLEAFDAIESYKESTETLNEQANDSDETVVQVIHSFVSGLSNLYDCCKNSELVPRMLDISQHIESDEDGEQRMLNGRHDDDLESRFVSVVATMLATAAGGYSVSRFLNQGQRTSLNLLRSMALHGSCRAFGKLVDIASVAFFVKKIDASLPAKQDCVTLLNHEAANAVAEEIIRDTVPDGCKVFVMYRILTTFLLHVESEPAREFLENRCLETFIPVVAAGLTAAKELDTPESLELLWGSFCKCLSQLLSPTQVTDGVFAIHAVPDLLTIIAAAEDNNTVSFRPVFCAVLSLGASKALEIARINEQQLATGSIAEDTVSTVKQQQQELLQLFQRCFEACCSLGTDVPNLHAITKSCLSAMLLCPMDDNDELAIDEEAGLIVCKTLQKDKLSSLVVSAFGPLCQLVTSKKAIVRDAVGQVLNAVNVADIVETARVNEETAEHRARLAEEKVKELSKKIQDLVKMNVKLNQEVAILQASTAM
jgi:hypothetical protein